ncbi:MAG TPA: hypothetical protein VK638_49115, partial [Edaphobacter sp.]|nr:hypothetical protein [Edaphobacter sp.]
MLWYRHFIMGLGEASPAFPETLETERTLDRVEVFTADHFSLNIEPAASANYAHHFRPLGPIVVLFCFPAFAATFSLT